MNTRVVASQCLSPYAAPVIGQYHRCNVFDYMDEQYDCNLVEICTRKIPLFKGNCIVRTQVHCCCDSN